MKAWHFLLFLLTFIFPGASSQLNAQILPNRYVESVFSNATKSDSIRFSTAVPQPRPGGGLYEGITGWPLNAQENVFDPRDLWMDVYTPTGDTMELRPLIILGFGGGFLYGRRDEWDMVLIAEGLAKRGFVVASIDYRLGMNIFDEQLSKRAVYRGVQDGRSAIRYFKNDASTINEFRIDTNQVFMGGHSSGAFIAIHTSYLDKDSERPASTREYIVGGFFGSTTYPDLGCLDCVGDNSSYYGGGVSAIFNLAGAIGELTYLESADDVPIISFHSTEDSTVPYNTGAPFSFISGLVLGFDLPDVYGTLPIHTRAESLGMTHDSLIYNNLDHSPHLTENELALNPDVLPNISSFFYENSLKPENATIIGEALVCNNDLLQTYSASGDGLKYYEWNAIGGTVMNTMNQSSMSIIEWDPLEPTHKVQVTPYSALGAKGNTTEYEVNITTGELIQWNVNGGDWMDASNWIGMKIPSSCDDVEITSVTPITVSIPNHQIIQVKSLTLDGSINLSIPSNTVFRIKP